VGRLSGGSKAHWLARAYGGAFLVRGEAGRVVAEARPGDIVDRVLDVLGQAAASLSAAGTGTPASAAPAAGSPRFEFVHDPKLRPVLQQAHREAREALSRGDHVTSFRTSCGILEAILTDALEHAGGARLAAPGAPAGPLADWPFATRIAVAERAGLIQGGCARLPPAALRYRDHGDGEGEAAAITEREARTVGQVLNVVMRDLDPGR